jgi:hypothetical protein
MTMPIANRNETPAGRDTGTAATKNALCALWLCLAVV